MDKTRKQFVQDGIEAYTSRLKKYARLKWIFVEASRAVLKEERRHEESGALARRIPDDGIAVVFDLGGKQLGSEQFASLLKEGKRYGKIYCIIGGSDGLELYHFKKCRIVSFGKMTFEHELVRLMALEQIFRGFAINAGAPYHK